MSDTGSAFLLLLLGCLSACAVSGAAAPPLPRCAPQDRATAAIAGVLTTPVEPCYEVTTIHRTLQSWGCKINSLTTEILSAKPFGAAALSGLQAGDRLLSVIRADTEGNHTGHAVGHSTSDMWHRFADSTAAGVVELLSDPDTRSAHALVIREPTWAGLWESQQGRIGIRKVKLFTVRFNNRSIPAKTVGPSGPPDQPCPQGGAPPPPGFSRLEGGMCGEGLYLRWVAGALELCFADTEEGEGVEEEGGEGKEEGLLGVGRCRARFFAERVHPTLTVSLAPEKDGTYTLPTLRKSKMQLAATLMSMYNVLLYVGYRSRTCLECIAHSEIVAGVSRTLKLSDAAPGVSVVRIDADATSSSALLRRHAATTAPTFVFLRWGTAKRYRGAVGVAPLSDWVALLASSGCSPPRLGTPVPPPASLSLSLEVNLQSLGQLARDYVWPRLRRRIHTLPNAGCTLLAGPEGALEEADIVTITKNFTFDKGVVRLPGAGAWLPAASEGGGGGGQFRTAGKALSRIVSFINTHATPAAVEWEAHHALSSPRFVLYPGSEGVGSPLGEAFLHAASLAQSVEDTRRGEALLAAGTAEAVEGEKPKPPPDSSSAPPPRQAVRMFTVAETETAEGSRRAASRGVTPGGSGRVVLWDAYNSGGFSLDPAQWCGAGGAAGCTSESIEAFHQSYSNGSLLSGLQSGLDRGPGTVVGHTHGAVVREEGFSLILYVPVSVQHRRLRGTLRAVQAALEEVSPGVRVASYHMTLSDNEWAAPRNASPSGGVGPVEVVHVLSASRPEAEGMFRKTSLVVRGSPVWESLDRSGRALYTDSAGHWLVGQASAIDSESGWVCSEFPEPGVPPHEVRRWAFWDPSVALWRRDPLLKVVGAAPVLRLWRGGVLLAECPAPVLSKAPAREGSCPAGGPSDASVHSAVRCLRGLV